MPTARTSQSEVKQGDLILSAVLSQVSGTMSVPPGNTAVAKAVDKIYLLINSQMLLEQKQAKIEATVRFICLLCLVASCHVRIVVVEALQL